MVVAAATFIVLLGYWIADYGVEPYFKVEPCNNNASTYNSSLGTSYATFVIESLDLILAPRSLEPECLGTLFLLVR